MQEMQVRSLGREDPLEKEMATHSGTLVWKLPWMEKPGRLTVHGVPKSGTQLSDFTFTFSLSFLGASRMPHPLQQGAPSISSVFPRHIWSQLCSKVLLFQTYFALCLLTLDPPPNSPAWLAAWFPGEYGQPLPVGSPGSSLVSELWWCQFIMKSTLAT